MFVRNHRLVTRFLPRAWRAADVLAAGCRPGGPVAEPAGDRDGQRAQPGPPGRGGPGQLTRSVVSRVAWLGTRGAACTGC
jgi:hypothetical protein